MISVQDAQAHILERITTPAQPELLPLAAALGRVLALDVRAEMDVPPTDNSAVDGYAVAAADIPATSTRALEVVAELAAGSVFAGTLRSGQALRIMTGAPMPAGADTVFPQEIVERRGSLVIVGRLAPGANMRRRLVRQKPRVAVLSTGDEVAEPGSSRKPGQVYDSNRFSLRGLVEANGALAVDDGIVPDHFEELHARLLRAAEHADVVLTSGGVSVGDYDLVKAVLEQAGGIDFWQVAMQPGRPLAVGGIGRAHFFGLPGNPVASMLTFHLFVRPALWKLAGRRALFGQPFRATAVEPMGKKTGRREFKRGILSYAHDRWEVRTTGPQGSGILTSMTAANCFIVIEEERGDVAAGESVWVEPFQPF